MSKTRTFNPALASEIGSRILVRRNLLGLTQHELASASGLSRGHVAMLELGKTTPSASMILGLCRSLGVRPDELLGWTA